MIDQDQQRDYAEEQWQRGEAEREGLEELQLERAVMGSAAMGARFLPGQPDPDIAYVIRRTEAEAQALAEPVNWDDYRKCRICAAETGHACCSMSSGIAGGQPDGIRTPLPRAHGGRERRRGR